MTETPNQAPKSLATRAFASKVTKPSKAEVRRWLARAREDVRDVERALAADDWDGVQTFANDLSGVGAEIANIVEARLTGTDPTGTYAPMERYDS